MSIFKFKKFDVIQTDSPQKVGTDAMVLGALVSAEEPRNILDVGTGCGVIALMLAQRYPNAQITGVDIDKQAILQAKANFDNASFFNHFDAFHTNYLDYHPNEKIDLIVSNPPFYNSKMPSVDQQRSLARHENSMSIKNLINHSAVILNKDGELWIIVPSERTEELIQDEKYINLKMIDRIEVYGKPGRHIRDVLIYAFESKTKLTPLTLTIREENGDYTSQYIELTKSYHYNTL